MAHPSHRQRRVRPTFPLNRDLSVASQRRPRMEDVADHPLVVSRSECGRSSVLIFVIILAVRRRGHLTYQTSQGSEGAIGAGREQRVAVVQLNDVMQFFTYFFKKIPYPNQRYNLLDNYTREIECANT